MDFKRMFDLLLSIFSTVILLPLFPFVALIIKIDSSGDVIFKQHRVGLNGKIFEIYKFRTMKVISNCYQSKITVGEDSRITHIGRILRKFKLDELPQLINILKGDMSFVGPRPEVPEYVQLYPSQYSIKIFTVRPGLTDYASIRFRDESKLLATQFDPIEYYKKHIIRKKLKYAVFYIDHMSFLEDVRIMILTIAAILK
jgi:lipopolysaccharide/colanic/teichoic acid biosynthesis glycosyltransferase